MEVTRTKVLLLATALLAVSFSNKFEARSKAPARTERWMEASLPTEVAGLKMIPSRDNPLQSYREAEGTYQQLKPYGIVCRNYGTQRRGFSTEVVASNSIDSFHDPEGCLPGYRWNILSSEDVLCPTRRRGKVPIRLLRMQTPLGARIGAICYKGNEGFESNHRRFAWDWVRGELRGGRAQEGVFYRFIQGSEGESEADLLAFVAAFLDGACAKSEGTL